MDDSTYTFIQHQRETKAAALGAKAKRNGSRSKRCTLPSDNLTPAQKKGLNGPMQTYDMNKPHTLHDLKLWPADLRHEYIRNIIDKYQPSNYELSDMLGCSGGYVSHALRSHFGIVNKLGRTRHRTRDQANGWYDFLLALPTKEPDPEPLPEVVSWPVTTTSSGGAVRYDAISVQFTGTRDDLIRVIQTGPLHLTGAGTYTFTITAARKED